MNSNAAIKLVIDSRIENVFLVGIAVNRICSHLDLGDMGSGQVELCVVEAVTNSIKHSYSGTPGREVTLTVNLLTDRVEFQISDHGSSMPPGLLANPTLEFDPQNLESLPQSGMGLFLIHQIMDEVHYVPGEGKNTLTLVKRIRGARQMSDCAMQAS